MAQDEAKPTGPDLARGISLDRLADGGTLVGHVGEDDVLLVRRGPEIFAVGRALHALSRAACRRSGGRRHGAMSVASCLFRSSHRRSLAAPALTPDRVLVGRAARRQDFRHRKAGGEAEIARQRPRRARQENRHRRRRRGRLCRGRNAAARTTTRAASSC